MSDEPPQAGFRNRGADISRVEGFADCAFGFAVTLLVVSLDVPRTFAGLVAALQGIPAFALSFAILAWIWYTQYRFFRKYGLEDVTTVLLTLVLLFVVLCYVYPLKFLYTASLGGSVGEHDLRLLFVIYGVGVAATFSVLLLMHANAYRQRDRLGLDALERSDTRIAMWELAGVAAIGLLSGALAQLPIGANFAAAAGFVYFLNGVVFTVGARRRRQLRRGA
ncbi:MAG TPA: TMEM175 family protein [Terriglobales bacterium]|nr:TMEM175 family protein [Terriglobales bacterium]